MQSKSPYQHTLGSYL